MTYSITSFKATDDAEVIEALLERWAEHRSEELLTRILRAIAHLMELGKRAEAEAAAARVSEVTGISITLGTVFGPVPDDAYIAAGNNTRH